MGSISEKVRDVAVELSEKTKTPFGWTIVALFFGASAGVAYAAVLSRVGDMEKTQVVSAARVDDHDKSIQSLQLRAQALEINQATINHRMDDLNTKVDNSRDAIISAIHERK